MMMMKRTSTSSSSYSTRDNIAKSFVDEDDLYHHHQQQQQQLQRVPKKSSAAAPPPVAPPPRGGNSGPRRNRRKNATACCSSFLIVASIFLLLLLMTAILFCISATILVSKQDMGRKSKIADKETPGGEEVSSSSFGGSFLDTKKHIDEQGRALRHAAAASSSRSSSITNISGMTVFTSALLNTSLSSSSSSSQQATSIIDRSTSSRPLWYWIGIARDAAEIQPAIWDYMIELNCLQKGPRQQQPVIVHVLVGTNKEYGIKERDKRRLQQNQCAPFLIEDEHDDEMIPFLQTANNGTKSVPVVPTNNISRVERIARIRDAQRERLRSLWKDEEHKRGEEINNNNNDIVMVADLDLHRFPRIDKVISQVQNMNGQDAICAAGVTMAAHSSHNREKQQQHGGDDGELWYYDTFALVFLPDTFAHPLKRRLIKRFYPGEDHALVRSDNQNGRFTQGDIMRHLQQVAAAASFQSSVRTSAAPGNHGVAPVRSCFAGLAIYRASTYFTDECQYSVQLPPPPPPPSTATSSTTTSISHPLYRYASEVDGRPCEHVVFHTCLHDTAARMNRPPVEIAVNPNLIAWWKKN